MRLSRGPDAPGQSVLFGAIASQTVPDEMVTIGILPVGRPNLPIGAKQIWEGLPCNLPPNGAGGQISCLRDSYAQIGCQILIAGRRRPGGFRQSHLENARKRSDRARTIC